jgi:hypothetical protein
MVLSNIKEKLSSKMFWDGILLNYKDKESKIKISFDDISNNIKDSFKEGFFKGLGVMVPLYSIPLLGYHIATSPNLFNLVGGSKNLSLILGLLSTSYPAFFGITRAIEGYSKVNKEARELIKNNELTKELKNDVLKASVKGFFLSGFKGLVNSILDYIVIGGLSLVGVSILGPLGFLLVPFIGGFYNVIKDKIREK